ncbi:hypothetical protein QBC41DRAFT_307190 [Cercophora samala]|uniref:Uncharacterized protein n=1 Tax=Cercophora samala TaxID=330535 RepID=A0AA40D554_9PEZI|nr:hypothetical protein QBC41DRAFT_307190 [Cercophora samala]
MARRAASSQDIFVRRPLNSSSSHQKTVSGLTREDLPGNLGDYLCPGDMIIFNDITNFKIDSDYFDTSHLLCVDCRIDYTLLILGAIVVYSSAYFGLVLAQILRQLEFDFVAMILHLCVNLFMIIAVGMAVGLERWVYVRAKQQPRYLGDNRCFRRHYTRYLFGPKFLHGGFKELISYLLPWGSSRTASTLSTYSYTRANLQDRLDYLHHPNNLIIRLVAFPNSWQNILPNFVLNLYQRFYAYQRIHVCLFAYKQTVLQIQQNHLPQRPTDRPSFIRPRQRSLDEGLRETMAKIAQPYPTTILCDPAFAKGPNVDVNFLFFGVNPRTTFKLAPPTFLSAGGGSTAPARRR